MSTPIRILIVEDRPADAGLAMREIRKVLADCEFQCVETEDDFSQALGRFVPDLILSDYHLPHFTGMQALQLALKCGPDTPVIIFTGSLNEEIAVDCIRAGAANYVIKENLIRLGPAVLQALEEKQVRLEREWALQELKYLGLHDALTGLHNRNFFMEEIKRLDQGREFPISVIMADADDLKETNDQKGHDAGDDVLKRIASVLREAFRASDIVARVGGDEFAVLLPGIDLLTAQMLLQRTRQGIQGHNNANSPTPIKVSLGAGTAARPGTLTAALKEADENMYREKREHNAPI